MDGEVTPKQNGRYPKGSIVLDVAVLLDEKVLLGIEVVHTHGVSLSKRRKILKFGVPVFVVDSDWVLSRSKPPKKWEFIEVIGDDERTRFAKNLLGG